ncbi:host attachment protein [Gilvimarinus sp. F26214L]|uniref:host attachment protein n=1 Tax=Gilvimarinus sp. DZF01 TaxID=3461371 RepID=UPI00404602CE
MPKSNDIWILTADRRRARIFSAERPHSQDITEIDSFFQPDSAFQDRELVEPKPGRQWQGGTGRARHGVDSRTSEREKSATKFVRDLVGKLEKDHHNGRFSKLVLVAAPDVLGEIRNQLSNNLKQDVTFELDKELTMLRPQELRGYLPKALAPLSPQ